VFNFARRMIERLQAQCDAQTRRELASNVPVIKAAALLHDIGHGPFSHVFERVFERDGHGTQQALDHEGWTSRMILGSSTEVHQILVESGIDPGRVAVLITDKPPIGLLPPVDYYLKDIVHSQLDADRMDYLLRDSLMTGSRFGQFDAEWILNVLAIGELPSGKGHIRKVCLDASKGIGAIEGMLHARLNMTKYVYGHKTTRAYEAELLSLLRLAGELVPILPVETPLPVRNFLEKRGDVEIKDYLLLDDEVMWWAIRRWAVWKPTLKPDRQALADALGRHSLRLVRRQRPWRTRRLRSSQELRQEPQLVQKQGATRMIHSVSSGTLIR
jgi:HD superfamily phosphohydrolase